MKEEGQVALKCLNPQCPEKVKREIAYFVSRDAMNITGLGEKIVEKFIELGKIKTVVDIYSLKNYAEELENLEKMGKKSVENLINSIEESKKQGFSKVLYALGIPFVGKFNENNWAKIVALKEIGLQFEAEKAEEEKIEDNPIKGKSFLATGKLEKYKRNDIKDIILAKGGNYLSGVTKKLDYLIAGEKAGSKLSKAEELGVRVLTEEEFEKEFLEK